ncbi:MAG: hypothetical protein VB089_12275 [Anaerolineaceae bacterium]|nr:hypothetical protein [Anaerolineaceae bacterium]
MYGLLILSQLLPVVLLAWNNREGGERRLKKEPVEVECSFQPHRLR